MRNRTYGGVRGRKTKVGEKLLRFPPTRFSREVRGDMFAGQLILLPRLGVRQSTLLFKSISTRYGIEEITEKFFSTMFVTITIIYNNISSPTISTFGFAIIHSFLVF